MKATIFFAVGIVVSLWVVLLAGGCDCGGNDDDDDDEAGDDSQPDNDATDDDDSGDDDSEDDDTNADDDTLTGPGDWETRTPMPTARSSLSVAVVDGNIYAMGGMNLILSPDTCLTTVEIYDPETDSWQTGPPLPQPRLAAASGVIDGKIYLAGGYNFEETNGYYLDRLDRFDPAVSEWMGLAPMPTRRSLAAGAVLDGRLYVIGGRNDDGKGMQVLDAVEVFDPETGAWDLKNPLPTAMEATAAVTIDHVIYLAGGWDGTPAGYRTNLLIYDSDVDSWSPGPSMTQPRCSLAAAALWDRYALFLGGYLDGWPPFRDAVEAFDTLSMTWITLTVLPEGRGGLGAAAVANRVFAIGGGAYDIPTDQPWTPRGEVWEFVM